MKDSTGTVRETPLALSAEDFRRLDHRLVDEIALRLSAIPAGPVTPGETPAAVREALGAAAPLPEHGSDPGAILDRATRCCSSTHCSTAIRASSVTSPPRPRRSACSATCWPRP